MLTCPCCGDRMVRHNAVRNVVFEEASDASLRPEREKAGLLPARPADDGLAVMGGERRPADVWVPRGPGGTPEAFDFAITSGLRHDLLSRATEKPSDMCGQYEHFKLA